ncbi:MAG: hypothetical protein IPO08_23430 [Xanthomonadales bacterium]|nr:hypothetical protein [Xanthomonadales bacterium]
MSADESEAKNKEGTLGYNNPSLFGKTATLGNKTVAEGDGRIAVKALSPILTPVLSAISPVAGMVLGMTNTGISASDGNNNGVIGMGLSTLGNVLGISPAVTAIAKQGANAAGLGNASYKGGDTSTASASPSTSGYAPPTSTSVAASSGTSSPASVSDATTSSISSASPSIQVGGLSNRPSWLSDNSNSDSIYDAASIAKRVAAQRAADRMASEGILA